MKRLPVALLFWLVLVLVPAIGASLVAEEASAPVAAPAEPAVAVTGRLVEQGGHRVLTLWGSPRERGFAQGYLTAERILAGLDHDFERVLGTMLPLYKGLVRPLVVPRFQFDEDETAELEGLMEGIRARLPEEKLTIAALGRPVDLIDLKALNTFGDWYGLGCSSLAVWGELTKDGQPLVGRNFDFPGFALLLAHQLVVVRAPLEGRRGQVGVSYPGCIGAMTGMNTDGVFVAIHDVRVRPAVFKALRGNVPRLLAVRRILEQVGGANACSQARDLLRTWPTLYGNNLMVVSPSGGGAAPCAGVLEYDNRDRLEEGCTLRCAVAGEDDAAPAVCLTCTNHHRDRPDPPSLRGPTVPSWRYDTLVACGGEGRPAEPLDVDAMFAWMDKVAFPREGRPQKQAETLRGVTQHKGTLHQAVGEPDARRLHLKMGAVGHHISRLPARAYDVPALVAAAH